MGYSPWGLKESGTTKSLSTAHMDMVFGSDSKDSACNAGNPGSDSWVRQISWRRECLPTPVFLPGEFHAQRRMVGYSPSGHKESDTTEVTERACR